MLVKPKDSEIVRKECVCDRGRVSHGMLVYMLNTQTRSRWGSLFISKDESVKREKTKETIKQAYKDGGIP